VVAQLPEVGPVTSVGLISGPPCAVQPFAALAWEEVMLLLGDESSIGLSPIHSQVTVVIVVLLSSCRNYGVDLGT
jgi:hypothetical protein